MYSHKYIKSVLLATHRAILPLFMVKISYVCDTNYVNRITVIFGLINLTLIFTAFKVFHSRKREKCKKERKQNSEIQKIYVIYRDKFDAFIITLTEPLLMFEFACYVLYILKMFLFSMFPSQKHFKFLFDTPNLQFLEHTI